MLPYAAVRANKRRWFDNLQQRDPEHLQELRNHTEWTVESLDTFLLSKNERKPNTEVERENSNLPCQRKRQNTAWWIWPGAGGAPRPFFTLCLAAVIAAGRGVRFGEALHPRPELFNLNIGGAPGCWRLYEESFCSADVISLQEVSMFPNAWLAFQKKVSRCGYRGYYQPGPIFVDSNGAKRIKGGVALFINKFVPHKFHGGFCHQDVQGISTWTNGYLFLNCDAPPGSDLVMAEKLCHFWVEADVDRKTWTIIDHYWRFQFAAPRK